MTNYNERLDEALRNHRGRVLTYHELFRKQHHNPHRLDEDLAHADAVTKQAITSLIKELVVEVIGDDYPEPTRRYSGGIWLGDKQINWLDIEKARRHYQARNIEKSELHERLHAAIKDTTKGDE